MSAAAITVDAAGLWYGALCATYETSAAKWDEFAAELRECAGREGFRSEVADGFVDYLGQRPDPMDTVRKLCENGPDWITAQHLELFAEAETEPVGEDYDEKVWFAFLAENGTAWNGDEANWTAFTEWFVHEAAQAGLGTPAHEFVTYVMGKPDRIAAFAEFGLTVGAPAEEQAGSFPALSEGDSGEWVAYLDQMLTAHGF